jgi:hypothetical protein
MKRVFLFCLAAMTTVAVSGIAVAQSQASSSPSLGDYARAVKKTKSPEKNSGKVYDNDNLPNSSSLSVVGQTTTTDAEQDKDKDKDKDPGSQAKEGDKTADGKTADEKSETGKKGDKAQLKAGQGAEERQKALAAWKAKLDEQKSQVSLLTRELDVLQREHDIKATEFNGDTARRVQNPSGFAAEDAKYKKQIAEKQKAVDAAKGKLSEMQEEARKSGAPNSVAE